MSKLTKAERGFLIRLARTGRQLIAREIEDGQQAYDIVDTAPRPTGEAEAPAPIAVRESLVLMAERRGWIAEIEDADGQQPSRVRRFTLTQSARELLDEVSAKADQHAIDGPRRVHTQAAPSASKALSSSAGGTQARRIATHFGIDSPLVWLRNRKDNNGQPFISDAELEAAQRFRSDFDRANAIAPTTVNWHAAETGGTPNSGREAAFADRLDRGIAAKVRLADAIGAVGPELASVLVDVCCHGIPLANIEKSQAWPQRSAKVVVQIALQQLARHYGLATRAPGGNNAGGNRNPSTKQPGRA
ncbi:MAG: DUF6456 domain-containing protein [Pseudomonadota bacterium]